MDPLIIQFSFDEILLSVISVYYFSGSKTSFLHTENFSFKYFFNVLELLFLQYEMSWILEKIFCLFWAITFHPKMLIFCFFIQNVNTFDVENIILN